MSSKENPQIDTDFVLTSIDIHSINPDKMSRAQSIVDSVNELVYNQLKTKFPQFKMRPTEPLVLQGSVADGTKVLKPDEFDYMIPMNLCADQWKTIETSRDTCDLYHVKRRFWKIISEAFNTFKAKVTCDRRNSSEVGHRRHVDDDICEKQRISASSVYDGCYNCIQELKSDLLCDSGKNFYINRDAYYRDGPAITLEVDYKSDECLDEPDLTLKIDYVPALCIGERYFVCTTAFHFYEHSHVADDIRGKLRRLGHSKYWRESFSNKELLLMEEIREQAPAMFEMYMIFKAVLADPRFVHDESSVSDHILLTTEEHYIKYMQPILRSYSHRSECARILCSYSYEDAIPIIDQSTCHLKYVLFHLWDREELRGADEQTLAAEYMTLLNECVARGYFINYFTGNEVGGKFRKLEYRQFLKILHDST